MQLENTERALCLSFSPLPDARIAFRECDTFFFGTASRNGGNICSSSDCSEGINGQSYFQREVRNGGKNAVANKGLTNGVRKTG